MCTMYDSRYPLFGGEHQLNSVECWKYYRFGTFFFLFIQINQLFEFEAVASRKSINFENVLS